MLKSLAYIWITILLAVPLFGQHLQRCSTVISQDDMSSSSINLATSSWNRGVLGFELVIHVVQLPNQDPISDQQILNQIEVLNAAFMGDQLSQSIIPAAFASSIDIPNFSFCLATQDPDGQSTTGIIRKETEVIHIAATDNIKSSTTGGSDAWDPNRYINIWIGDTGGLFIGRATFPDGVPAENQGIIMDVNYFGGEADLIGKAPYDLGKTLVHEMGHFFGLEHTWGSSLADCSIDDGIADTPWTASTYLNTCLNEAYTCGSMDMTGNFMTYSNDACLVYFTKGQISMMRQVILQYRPALIGSCIGQAIQGDVLKTQVKAADLSGWLVQFESANSIDDIQYVLYNLGGQSIIIGSTEANEQVFLPLSNAPRGIYILAVVQGAEKQALKLFR